MKESHYALLHVVSALQELNGACLSLREAIKLNICPFDKRVVEEERIKIMGIRLLLGLVMLEGSLPVAHLNPILHSLVHFAVETARV